MPVAAGSRKNIHEMEAVAGYRRYFDVNQYWVKWKNWPVSASTWEPWRNILDPSSEILVQMAASKTKWELLYKDFIGVPTHTEGVYLTPAEQDAVAVISRSLVAMFDPPLCIVPHETSAGRRDLSTDSEALLPELPADLLPPANSNSTIGDSPTTSSGDSPAAPPARNTSSSTMPDSTEGDLLPPAITDDSEPASVSLRDKYPTEVALSDTTSSTASSVHSLWQANSFSCDASPRPFPVEDVRVDDQVLNQHFYMPPPEFGSPRLAATSSECRILGFSMSGRAVQVVYEVGGVTYTNDFEEVRQMWPQELLTFYAANALYNADP